MKWGGYLLGLFMIFSGISRADGFVNFATRVSGQLDAPVTDTYGIPVDGRFYAQLVVIDPTHGEIPVGDASPFRSDVGVGYITAGGKVRVPTLGDTPGGPVRLKVVAWSRMDGGTNYQQFRRRYTCGAFTAFGESVPIDVIAGPTPETAANLVGLKRFTIVTPLSPWEFFAVVRINGEGNLEVDYPLGLTIQNHVLEQSVNLVDWIPFRFFTNGQVAQGIVFVLTNREPVQFFRMQRLGCDW